MQDHDKPQPEKKHKSRPKPSASKKPTAHRASFGSMIAIIALVIAGFTFYQVKNLKPQLQQVTAKRSEVTSQVQQQFNQAQATITNFQSQLKTLQKAQEQQQTFLQTMSEQLQAVKNADHVEDNHWVVKQAIYLIKLAYLNQQFGHDREQTISLLSAADQQIKALNEPALLKVRQALANDMTLLKAQPKIDKAGLLIQLTAMTKQVNKLVLRTPIKASEIDQIKQEKAQPNTSKWKNALNQSLSTLQKIVIIRHQQKPVQAVMGPLQHELLLRTIAYQLQQAQWAILQDDIAVFKQSVQQAKDSVSDNFDIEKPQTKTFLTELDKLQKLELDVEKAKLKTSIKLLNKYLVQYSANRSKQ